MHGVVVYGSVARGQEGPDSDVDLLVHWHGSEGDGLRQLVPIATDIFLDTGILLSVHPVAPAHWDEMARIRTRFFQNIDREGLLVAG